MTSRQSRWRRSVLATRRSVLATTIGVSLAASLALAGVAGAATTPGGAAFGPGASGSVAAITGSSMEVQNQQTGQVTVSWAPTTTFSQIATVPASSVAAGDCVTVSGSSSKGTITAKTVTVSQPTAGTCNTGGVGGGGRFAGGGPGSAAGGSGTPPSGASGRRPGGFPGGRPGGAGGGGRPGFGRSANFGFASGKVTSATQTALVISGFSSATIAKQSGSSKNSKNTKQTKKPPAVKATTVKITINSTTTYNEDQPAAATALAVGDCVSAAGTSSSTGAVSATSIRITSTGGKACTTGFGRGATSG